MAPAATGDWLRFIGDVKGGLSGLSHCNRAILKKGLKKTGKKEFTLDIDATQIVAEKLSARLTYKGEHGYMPIVGHIAETGMVVHEEFRDINITPSTSNMEIIKKCCARMPTGKRVARFRADSASYQAENFQTHPPKNSNAIFRLVARHEEMSYNFFWGCRFQAGRVVKL